jgi:hypothetical protein
MNFQAIDDKAPYIPTDPMTIDALEIGFTAMALHDMHALWNENATQVPALNTELDKKYKIRGF